MTAAVTITRHPKGGVKVAPAEYLGGSWSAYKGACDRHGFKYDGDKAQKGDVRSLPGLLDAFKAAGFEIGLDLEIRAELEVHAESVVTDANAMSVRMAEVQTRLAKQGLALFAFQRTGVEWLAPRRGALLADQMGIGKTIQALVALPENAPVLLVCPASLKFNWADETAKWRPDYTVTVLKGRKSFRMPKNGEIVIVNYDILPAVPAEGETHDAPKGLVLLGDEVHALKNAKAARTRKWSALRDAAFAVAGRVWGLTGTPMLNRPQELWNVLRALGLEREAFGDWNEFLRLFGGYRGRFGYVWGKPLTEEVVPALHAVSLSRTRAEVLPDLPIKRYKHIAVEDTLDRTTQDECDDAEQAIFDNGGNIPFEEISKARAMLARHKIPTMLAKVAEYEEAEEPYVVFSAHRAPVDTLGERDCWATITGDTPHAKRAELVKAFQAGELKGLALTIKAGGVGLTLTHGAHVLFVDLEWTPALNEQAEDRICRIGQSRGCLIETLVAKHSLDRRLAKLLQKKQTLIDASTQAAATTERSEHGTDAAADILASLVGLSTPDKVMEGKTPVKPCKGNGSPRKRRPGGKEWKPRAQRRKAIGPVEEWAAAGLLTLADLDPDHALEENGVGFNKLDGAFGHSLAEQLEKYGTLSEKQWNAAIRMLLKYKGQIGECPK